MLTPDVAALTGAVAARYAGIRSDVLRLAVPPRHATVEKETSEPAPPIDATPAPRTSRVPGRSGGAPEDWRRGGPPGRLVGAAR